MFHVNVENTSIRKTYMEKVEADLGVAKAELELLREKAKLAAAETALLYRRQIDELEMRFAETKARLQEMNDADDSAWENFKDEVERAWNSMKESMMGMVDKMTDDGDHPPYNPNNPRKY